jgi:hypothetical protein
MYAPPNGHSPQIPKHGVSQGSIIKPQYKSSFKCVCDSIMDHFHNFKKHNNLLLHRFITQSKIMKSQKLRNPIKTTIVLMNKSINYMKFSSSRFSLNYTIHKRDENSSSCSSWDQSHCQWILVAIPIWSLKTSACTLWLLCDYFHDKFLLGDN